MQKKLIKLLAKPANKYSFIKFLRGVLFSSMHYSKLELKHNYLSAYKPWVLNPHMYKSKD